MGDRYVPRRHANIALLLQRPASVPLWSLPGIGHNGGPPLDLSGNAWIWRRAAAKAWKSPPREVVMQRLRRAGRLGLTYRDISAALLDTGSYLETALLPLHELAGVSLRHDGSIDLRPDAVIAELLQRFEGRLFVVADAAVSGPVDARRRRQLEAALRERFGARIEGLLVLPFRLGQSMAGRAALLRRRLTARGLHRKECFWLGRTQSEQLLAQAAGLGCFKPLAGWFAS
ncbi:MAG TPA: hypothetical protein VKZ87_08660 [Ferrovibrio sp.]|jgi:hypothetical protein|uniref:hypothetical protein n=1 Tax=Ferrovibrio sp. TaxID=1917215 RepID=UPI002B4B5573|nr:hypothetical protein [Ferrovibrio sp.]HLT77444.1 hypothetical protein [Ferrovibrio sp.]